MRNKKVKILFFHFDLGNGGAERVLVNLANSLDSKKYDVEIRTLFDNGPNRDIISDKVKYSSVFNFKPIRGVSSLLKLISPSILHKLFIPGKYDVEIAFREGCPSRIISGGDRRIAKYSWIHTTLNTEQMASRGYRNLREFRKCSATFKKIAAVSQSVCEGVKKWIPEFLNVEVVYNVIEPSIIRQKAQMPIDIVLERKNCLNLISVGRLTPVKSFDRLLHALRYIVDEGLENWHLYIIGVGEQEEMLRELTSKLGLANKVTFLGYQENPHKYVSRMDLFVCSSLIEGYSTAVTEAIINQVPVLTTDCSGMNEILSDYGAGMIVDNSEKGLCEGLLKILSDPQLLQSMKKAAVDRSMFFSKENSLCQFERFIFND